jgi:hypothetical protein
MLPNGNKIFFPNFFNIFSAGRNIAKIATKTFFQNFPKFPSICQNVARMAEFFFNFSKFQVLGKMLPE